jgi:2-succinyl-5-enolpyruvyl-6-hydroxy-3-cyclohexene-1-carboxylate synthase
LTHPNPSTALARVVVDELANRGVRLVVIAPGSRSGALAIASVAHPDIETRVFLDERSAAFHALGVARASGLPVVVVSTSGSAPAHFLPAIVEADMSCVPLIAVSADRPAEMQGVGANQTIDQLNLFGEKVRDRAGIEAPDASADRSVQWRGVVARLVWSATRTRPGPVHLNIRFREPTVPVTDDGRSNGVEYSFSTSRIADEGTAMDSFEGSDHLVDLDSSNGLLIAGDGAYDRRGLMARAADLGWPVLATAQSSLRGGPVVSTYHHLLAKEVPDELRPETVVAVGAIGPSPRLESLVGAAPRRVRIDRWGRSIDPERNATDVIQGDVVELLSRVAGASDPDWRERWSSADADCRVRLNREIAASSEMSGASVVVALNDVEWGSLAVASSLPIREVDAHLVRSGPVYANRGASGIDGFVSTALGIAGEIERTLALTGDLSLLHDSNGFINDAVIDLTLIVLDNGGGGLFDSLPQARHAPDFERLFVTPPNRSFADLARFHRLRFAEATSSQSLQDLARQALGRQGLDLIRVAVDRDFDLGLRRQLDG